MNPLFVDLCAGIGGFRKAFDNAGAECVLTCELDKFCKTTYTSNFHDKRWETDITKLDPSSVENFDILCAGFPCQAFSLGGKQAGFDDVRGTIFFNIADMLQVKRPKMALFENVKNLRSHDKGRTFKVIQAKLDSLDYHHHTILINAQHFVPQKRERIYIVCADKKYLTTEEFKTLIANIEFDYEKQKLLPLPKISDILESNVSSEFTLSDKLWSFLQSHAEKHSKKGNGFGYGLIEPKTMTTARTLTARYYKDGSEILIAQEGKNPRRLTPRECARIMGFPDSYQLTSSKTQTYKQFGNSVVLPVIELFAQRITEVLKTKP